MSTDHNTADRLLVEARAKTAREQSPMIGKVALGIGILAVLVSPVSVLGWVFGLAALGTGGAAVRKPASAKLAKIAMVLGVLAVLVGVFFFTMNIARN